MILYADLLALFTLHIAYICIYWVILLAPPVKHFDIIYKNIF